MSIKINYITFQNKPEYHMYMSENSLLSSEEKGFLEKNNISTSNISETIYYDDTIDDTISAQIYKQRPPDTLGDGTKVKLNLGKVIDIWLTQEFIFRKNFNV